MGVNKPHREASRSHNPLVRMLWRVGKSLHDRRWERLSPDAVRREIDRRLRLEGYYWLFVLGMNNSGTTLLARLLRSHPQVRSLPREGQRYTHALPRPSDYGDGRVWGNHLDRYRLTEEDDPAPALRMKYDWAYCYDSRPGVLLEKTPPNAVRSRWLQVHFQPCRFIATHRDPYASCEGIRRRKACDIAVAATHWARVNQCLIEDLPHLKHCLRLSYEQFTEQPRAALERIESFLGLAQPFDRSLLSGEFAVHNLDNQPSKIQSFNARSIARLSQTDIDTINRVAGPVIEAMGYRLLKTPVVQPSGR